MNKPVVSKSLLSTVGMASVAGMRTMLAPALVTNYFSKRPLDDFRTSSFNAMQRKGIAKGFRVMALAELVGDKLPQAKDRILPAPLIGRTLSGAVAGATIYKSERENAVIGAVVGAVAAAAATFAAFYIRKAIQKKTGIRDPFLGMIEDVLALGIGFGAMKLAERRK